jgi:iron complex outermembrane receptor protein
MRVHALWLSASVLALGWSGAAAAQTAAAPNEDTATQVQELVVTAERRASNLQTTPISATVLTGEDLQKKAITNVEQLQFAMPSLVVNNFGQGNDFNIRGIGKAEHNSQTTTGVITYRDGVATFPGYFQGEPYYDIAHVEVLRGPQGTFVGQNATGGAVFITSQDPIINGGHTGYLAGQVGNYADIAAQGALNLPVSDTLAARVAFDTERRDSFYDITGPNSNNPGVFIGSLRLGLNWKPTDALSVLFKTDYNYLNFGGYPADPVLAVNDPFELTANFPSKALDRFVRSSLKIDYTMDNGIILRSITGYQHGNTRYQTDLDGTSAGNNSFGDSVNETTWSEELNLISPSTGRLSWILGAYVQTDVLDFLPGQFFIGLPLGFPATEYRLEGTNPKQTTAVFGQVGFKLTDSLELQLGARYSQAETSNDVRVLQYGAPIVDQQSAKFSDTSGKVALNWTIDPHNFVYGFVATGFRPGGLNVPVGFGQPAPFDSEKVTEYEAGWKAGFLDGRLRTQVAAYYNHYENFQVTIGYPTLPIFGFELNTPEPTKIYGVEAQAEAVFGSFSFDAGLGLLRSEIGAFYATDPRAAALGACDPAHGPATATCLNLTGHEQTYAPEFTFNLGAQYVFDLPGGDTVTPRLNYGHVSEQWATLFENEARGDRVPARDIFSGQIAWTHGDIITTLYGTNLTDQQYMGALNSGLRFMGPPRQFGVRVFKRF